jgi:hypothetical protein
LVSTLREVAQMYNCLARHTGAHIHHLLVQHNDPEAGFLKSRVYAKLLR